jgi:hypothetical protein
MRKGLLVIAISALSLAVPAASQAEIFIHEKTPAEFGPYFVPCANGGAGEYVDLSGTFTSLFAETSDKNGGRHVVSQGRWTVSGVGETTGDRYQGSSNTVGTATFAPDELLGEQLREVTQRIPVRIVGRQANFSAYIRMHLTYTPDGTLTADVYETSVDCKS